MIALSVTADGGGLIITDDRVEEMPEVWEDVPRRLERWKVSMRLYTQTTEKEDSWGKRNLEKSG